MIFIKSKSILDNAKDFINFTIHAYEFYLVMTSIFGIFSTHTATVIAFLGAYKPPIIVSLVTIIIFLIFRFFDKYKAYFEKEKLEERLINMEIEIVSKLHLSEKREIDKFVLETGHKQQYANNLFLFQKRIIAWIMKKPEDSEEVNMMFKELYEPKEINNEYLNIYESNSNQTAILNDLIQQKQELLNKKNPTPQ